MNKNGFTLIEIILVITIMTILFTVTTVTYTDLISKNELEATTDQIVDILINTQSSARYNRYNNDWQVNFIDTEKPQRITQTDGEVLADQLTLPSQINLEIDPIVEQISFKQGSGHTDRNYELKLSNNSGTATVTVSSNGLILSELWKRDSR